jgi:hypothetical protein
VGRGGLMRSFFSTDHKCASTRWGVRNS